jgi:hypothetical protein
MRCSGGDRDGGASYLPLPRWRSASPRSPPRARARARALSRRVTRFWRRWSGVTGAVGAGLRVWRATYAARAVRAVSVRRSPIHAAGSLVPCARWPGGAAPSTSADHDGSTERRARHVRVVASGAERDGGAPSTMGRRARSAHRRPVPAACPAAPAGDDRHRVTVVHCPPPATFISLSRRPRAVQEV